MVLSRSEICSLIDVHANAVRMAANPTTVKLDLPEILEAVARITELLALLQESLRPTTGLPASAR